LFCRQWGDTEGSMGTEVWQSKLREHWKGEGESKKR
jgi:hypothetical protein